MTHQRSIQKAYEVDKSVLSWSWAVQSIKNPFQRKYRQFNKVVDYVKYSVHGQYPAETMNNY